MPDKMNNTWSSVKPEPRGNGAGGPTRRDVSNVALGGSISVILIWILHDGFGVHMPPEVAGAFATIGGYVTSRLLRY